MHRHSAAAPSTACTRGLWIATFPSKAAARSGSKADAPTYAPFESMPRFAEGSGGERMYNRSWSHCKVALSQIISSGLFLPATRGHGQSALHLTPFEILFAA